MAASKTQRALLASQALGAGASVNATEWNLTTAYGGRAVARITNGASAPTTAPIVKFYTGDASGKKYLLFTASGDITANSVTDISCEYNLADMYANVTVTGGATNGSTVEVYGQEATSL
jgi:hypothetical protein